MPTLNWIGKEAVVNHDKEVPFRLLKKVKSLSLGKNSQNLIINGDNLEALKALMPYYHGKIKCIYIDPPYNTGNEKWVYNDKVNSPKIKKWLGKVVGTEFEDLCRHDKWLCMMYPRLKLLNDLLTKDGVLFISIDDNEIYHLRCIMNELYEEDKIKVISIKMAEPTGVKMSNVISRGGIPKLKEYVLIYRKNGLRDFDIDKIPKENWDDEYKTVIDSLSKKEIAQLKNIMDNEQRTEEDVKVADKISSKIKAKPINEFLKDLNIPKKEQLKWKYDNAWRIFRTVATTQGAKKIADEKKKNIDQDFFVIETPRNKCYLILSSYNVSASEPNIKILFADDYLEVHPGDFWPDIKTTGLGKEGQVEFKSGKKPLELLKRLIKSVTKEEDIVLDSFAGSGTTGEAVLLLNKEDNLKRKFIMVEMEEHIAKEKTLKRIRNTLKKNKIKEGFEFCNLDKNLFNANGLIEKTCTFDQLATYIYFTETNTNIDSKKIYKNFIGEYDWVDYYLIYKEKGKNVLNKSFLKTIKKSASKKVIYADKCLIDEDVLERENIQFKQIPYEVHT